MNQLPLISVVRWFTAQSAAGLGGYGLDQLLGLPISAVAASVASSLLAALVLVVAGLVIRRVAPDRAEDQLGGRMAAAVSISGVLMLVAAVALVSWVGDPSSNATVLALAVILTITVLAGAGLQIAAHSLSEEIRDRESFETLCIRSARACWISLTVCLLACALAALIVDTGAAATARFDSGEVRIGAAAVVGAIFLLFVPYPWWPLALVRNQDGPVPPIPSLLSVGARLRRIHTIATLGAGLGAVATAISAMLTGAWLTVALTPLLAILIYAALWGLVPLYYVPLYVVGWPVRRRLRMSSREIARALRIPPSDSAPGGAT